MKTYTKALISRARELRTNMTEPEKRMWYQCLKYLPHRFRRQRPFGPYIVDFYCAEQKLVIEIDGDSHTSDAAMAYDAERTALLEELGLRVIRFSNLEVMKNIEGVFERLSKELCTHSVPPARKD
ncbi:MAG: endonuclease domain-containing protein [Desulfuromonas sp.]